MARSSSIDDSDAGWRGAREASQQSELSKIVRATCVLRVRAAALHLAIAGLHRSRASSLLQVGKLQPRERCVADGQGAIGLIDWHHCQQFVARHVEHFADVAAVQLHLVTDGYG